MAILKFTVCQNWTHYYNLYGMSPRFWDALSDKGWSKQKIDEYHKAHNHKVNIESAQSNVANGGPIVPEPGDKKWLKRHPALEGSG